MRSAFWSRLKILSRWRQKATEREGERDTAALGLVARLIVGRTLTSTFR